MRNANLVLATDPTRLQSLLRSETRMHPGTTLFDASTLGDLDDSDLLYILGTKAGQGDRFIVSARDLPDVVALRPLVDAGYVSLVGVQVATLTELENRLVNELHAIQLRIFFESYAVQVFG